MTKATPEQADPRRAYSHPRLSKADFLAELQIHHDADRLVQGAYFRNGDGWRGCAVGCSLESARRRLGLPHVNHADHAAYVPLLGIPRVLARLEDRIFEALPIDEAKEWPLRFSTAIPEGADLNDVWKHFTVWHLRELVLPAVRTKRVSSAVERVIAGYESEWANDTPQAALSVAAAAYAADAAAAASAYAAYAAAYAAANAAAASAYAAAAYAAYAADAAANAAAASAYDDAASAYDDAASAYDDAASAYDDAASAYAYAANAADAAAAYDADARLNVWRRMAAKLCELLAAAPVSTPPGADPRREAVV